MNVDLLHDLLRCETDVDGALRRFSNNEALYRSCLSMFLADQTMGELETAIKGKEWDDAFTAAHALKGLAGNMGFVPLFHAAAELVILIRAGKTNEVDASYARLERCYREITSIIRPHCGAGTKGERL